MATFIAQEIKLFLWYNNQAKEAASFYCSLFKNSRIISTSDLVVEFELESISFLALNSEKESRFGW